MFGWMMSRLQVDSPIMGAGASSKVYWLQYDLRAATCFTHLITRQRRTTTEQQSNRANNNPRSSTTTARRRLHSHDSGRVVAVRARKRLN
jgi:hypothetical protein